MTVIFHTTRAEMVAWIERCDRKGLPRPGPAEIGRHFGFSAGTARNLVRQLEAEGRIAPMAAPSEPAETAKPPAALVPEAAAPPVPSARPLLASVVAEEARVASARTMLARRLTSVAKPLSIDRLSTSERVMTAMVETPADLVALMRRKWPELWLRVIAAAREEGRSPVERLISAVETGLGGEAERSSASP